MTLFLGRAIAVRSRGVGPLVVFCVRDIAWGDHIISWDPGESWSVVEGPLASGGAGSLAETKPMANVSPLAQTYPMANGGPLSESMSPPFCYASLRSK